VIPRFLETFFRYKFLILLPAVLIPLIVTPITLVVTPRYFQSDVGIWVDRSAYLQSPGEGSPFSIPSQTQSTRLNELMRTRAFMLDVVGRTSLASLLSVSGGEGRARAVLDSGLSITPTGSNLVTISFRASTAQVAYEVVSAIVDAYQEKTATDTVDQAGVAIAFYQSQLSDAHTAFDKATNDLRSYAAAQGYTDNPDAASSNSPLSAGALDARLVDLQSRLEFARKQVDSARGTLEQARLGAAAAAQGQQLGFQVLDPPQLATAPSRDLRKALIFPIAALLIGIGLSGAMLVVLVAADRSVRYEMDVSPPLRVLGVVPQLNVKRLPKKLRPASARRAVGFAAGAVALPAAGGSK
jgi:uncharacterized protein involved in exopolysaccharide biosynthesis